MRPLAWQNRRMHAEQPVLNQLNLLVRDWEAALAFYRLLGLEVGSGAEFPTGTGTGRHADLRVTGSSMSLEFDDPASVGVWASDAGGLRTPVIGFAYPTSDAVDATCERLSRAGHVVRQAPFDAFWGARYAIVEDPDGHSVGLMGPVDRARGYPPGRPPR